MIVLRLYDVRYLPILYKNHILVGLLTYSTTKTLFTHDFLKITCGDIIMTYDKRDNILYIYYKW